MRRNSWFFGLLALSMLVWSPYDAAADWWKNESGKGKHESEYKNESGKGKHESEYKEEYKREYRNGDCKYEHKEDKEERKCKGGPSYPIYLK